MVGGVDPPALMAAEGVRRRHGCTRVFTTRCTAAMVSRETSTGFTDTSCRPAVSSRSRLGRGGFRRVSRETRALPARATAPGAPLRTTAPEPVPRPVGESGPGTAVPAPSPPSDTPTSDPPSGQPGRAGPNPLPATDPDLPRVAHSRPGHHRPATAGPHTRQRQPVDRNSGPPPHRMIRASPDPDPGPRPGHAAPRSGLPGPDAAPPPPETAPAAGWRRPATRTPSATIPPPPTPERRRHCPDPHLDRRSPHRRPLRTTEPGRRGARPARDRESPGPDSARGRTGGPNRGQSRPSCRRPHGRRSISRRRAR